MIFGIMTLHIVKFHIGQIVDHRKFGYRGVVFDVDAEFSASERWYETVAKSRPPKDAPWYHVLVDGENYTTYVAERNLIESENISPIQHPLIEAYFSGLAKNRYLIANRQ